MRFKLNFNCMIFFTFPLMRYFSLEKNILKCYVKDILCCMFCGPCSISWLYKITVFSTCWSLAKVKLMSIFMRKYSLIKDIFSNAHKILKLCHTSSSYKQKEIFEDGKISLIRDCSLLECPCKLIFFLL